MGNLVDRARNGDENAVAEIYRLIRAFARQICRGGGPSGAHGVDWEDVAQEAGIRVFTTGLSQYHGCGTEQSYLYSVVRATVIQMARSATRRQRRESISLPPLAADPNPGRRLDVAAILSALSEECRDLMSRVFLEGDTYGDIARDLDLAESSVRSKLSRCVASARKLTEEGRLS